MCDDFFDDPIENNSFDSDNDCEEDFADEHPFDDTELMDMPCESHSSTEQEEQRCFDLAETLIFGSMIYGNAYEEAIDEKRRRELLQSEEKRKA